MDWWKSPVDSTQLALYEWTVAIEEKKLRFLNSTAFDMRPHSTTRFSLLPLNKLHFFLSTLRSVKCKHSNLSGFSRKAWVSHMFSLSSNVNVRMKIWFLNWIFLSFFSKIRHMNCHEELFFRSFSRLVYSNEKKSFKMSFDFTSSRQPFTVIQLLGVNSSSEI